MIVNISHILNDEVLFIFNSIFSKNKDIMIVGGAVRDLIFNDVPSDIDFATTASPDEIKCIFGDSGVFKVITTGEKFGSITLFSIESKKKYEITTLRSDFNADGRYANVRFCLSFEEDAKRRDFTINAMYVDMNGRLYDFFNGFNDLSRGVVRFIGDIEERICEDYLRIMRFFRFVAKFNDVIDCDVILAIKKFLHGIKLISKERFTDELVKICKEKFAGIVLQKMSEIGIFYMRFGKNVNIRTDYDFSKFDRHEILCLLFSDLFVVNEFSLTLLEKRIVEFCLKNCVLSWSELTRENMMLCARCDSRFLSSCLNINFLLSDDDKKKLIDIPRMPINGSDIKVLGASGKKINQLLDFALGLWIDSGFTLSKSDIIEALII